MFTKREKSVKMLGDIEVKTRRGLRRERVPSARGLQGFQASYRKEQ